MVCGGSTEGLSQLCHECAVGGIEDHDVEDVGRSRMRSARWSSARAPSLPREALPETGCTLGVVVAELKRSMQVASVTEVRVAMGLRSVQGVAKMEHAALGKLINRLRSSLDEPAHRLGWRGKVLEELNAFAAELRLWREFAKAAQAVGAMSPTEASRFGTELRTFEAVLAKAIGFVQGQAPGPREVCCSNTRFRRCP